MINDIEKTTAYLVRWIRDQAEVAGARAGVVGISGGVDSAVVFGLCARALPLTIGVLLPCQSSAESIQQGMEVVKAFPGSEQHEVRHQMVVLDQVFQLIRSQLRVPASLQVEGSLRSCLRAPVLDFTAKAIGGLVYGTGNRDEDEIFRYYNKRGDGAVDNNVLGCLHKSEVYQLAKHLGVPQSVIDAVPTADLWGPNSGQADEKEMGITYEEIEWLTRLWSAPNTPYQYEWAREEADTQLKMTLTDRQWYVIQRGITAERLTRHKAEPPPSPARSQLHWRGLVD